jgi:hypothetical protein
MTTSAESAANATKGSADVSPPDSEERRAAMAAAADDVSPPDSPERRAALAKAVADVEAGVRAETYDTDGENTEA